MIYRILWPVLIVAGMLLAGCSTTSVSGSWSNPAFKGKLSKVYVVGISRDETVRRIFEDEFGRQLAALGSAGVPSYRDLPASLEKDKSIIANKVAANGADSVLMARATGKRTEEVVNPGRITSYDYAPRYSGRRDYRPEPYYRDYGGYYSRSYDITYEPATVSQFEVVTVEANLYDAATAELVWSAQLETTLEANMEKVIVDFVTAVTKDMHARGLL